MVNEIIVNVNYDYLLAQISGAFERESNTYVYNPELTQPNGNFCKPLVNYSAYSEQVV